MKLCLNDDSNAAETCTVLQIIPSDDENNVMLRIVQLKSSNVVTSILLRKPTDIEIKRHVLERYQQLKIKAHELHQSPDEQAESQGIETENVQISQTTAPPTTTTIYDRNDHDIDRREIYRDILQKNLFESVKKLNLGSKWVMQHDNDPKHRAHIVTNWLNEKGVERLKWPPYSPDLNPIEHMWDELERRMKKEKPKNATELKHALSRVWQADIIEISNSLDDDDFFLQVDPLAAKESVTVAPRITAAAASTN
ncbi:unnamed protein product [Rotaria socialis]